LGITMADNLIDRIQAIEDEADEIVKEAHNDAARLDRETDERIEHLRAELDSKYQEQAEAIAARVEDERKAEEDQLRRKAEESLKNIRALNVDEAHLLIDRIVARVSSP